MNQTIQLILFVTVMFMAIVGSSVLIEKYFDRCFEDLMELTRRVFQGEKHED